MSDDWRHKRAATLALLPDGKPPIDHGLRLPDPVPLPVHYPNWRDVPVPPKMSRVPRDKRGFPVPYHLRPDNFAEGGEADLRVVNGMNLLDCIMHHKCGVCGLPLYRTFVMSGGPLCVYNRIFTEPPLHEECARYAHSVCPFLTLPKFTHHDRPNDGPEHRLVDEGGVVGKEYWDHDTGRHCMFFTQQYLVLRRGLAMPLLVCKDAVKVEWYNYHGRYVCTTRPEGYGQ